MEILLAFIFGGAIGLLVHYTLPGRSTRGVALAPMIGAFAGGVVWMVLTWAGLTLDNPWLWLASLAAPIVVTYPVVAILARTRSAHDARERARLRIS
jgi:uncharacterized membrane protein YeaQ/YmgE (transglycosylase-associated protein family)